MRGLIELNKETEEKALRLHRDAIVIDGHSDTILKMLREQRRLGERSSKGHMDIPRMLEGGLDVQIFAVFALQKDEPLVDAMRLLDLFFGELEKNSDKIVLVTGYKEIFEAQKLGKISAILSIEGGNVLRNEVGVLRLLFKLGVRGVTLRHDSMQHPKGSLTKFEVEALSEMNRLGMLVDVSHSNEEAFYEIMDLSEKPPIASHSSCRSLCDHTRNLTDNQIRLLADKGGVIGITFIPWLLSDKQATLKDVLDHIDHAVRLVGPDYVGLGSDFDGIPSTPVGLEDVTKMPSITEGLLSKGYSDQDVKKILGGNYLRVLKKVLR